MFDDDVLVRPGWVDEGVWRGLSGRERMWCVLRGGHVHEDVMFERLGFSCERTWRYFQRRVRGKVFGV